MQSKVVKHFQKQYNEWKQKTSPIGRYAKRTTFNETTSGGLEDMIRAFFKMQGFKCWKVDVNGTVRFHNGRAIMTPTKSSKGVSDLFTIINGNYIAIEVKIGNDVQSDNQKAFEEDVIRQGGYYFIAKSFSDFLEKYLLCQRQIKQKE